MILEKADVILAGGGLANSLIALRLKAVRPQLKVVMLEKALAPEARHTWSFFESDLAGGVPAWLAPLIRRRWSGYTVRFPDNERDLSTPYASVDEAHLKSAVAEALGADFRHGADVTELASSVVRLRDGRTLQAPLVIDGRGAGANDSLWLRWQKFRGVELRLKQPHGLERPVVMDAQVRQLDGFRFIYLLPFDAKTVLVEDTRYSDDAELTVGVETDALRYARAQRWSIADIERREAGVLPIALGGDIERFWRAQTPGVPSVGLRAALFHPTTGYSLPDAVRTAEAISGARVLESAPIHDLVRRASMSAWRQRGYYRALNRMMFLAGAPDARWRSLARFYSLSQPLIERFYAGQSTAADRLRLVAGRPPVPVAAALRALFTSTPTVTA